MHRYSNLNMIHFADDSTLYAGGPCVHSLVDFVNTELLMVDMWLCANKLSLNISKSSFAIFTNKNSQHVPDILIRGQKLKYVKNTKFLGVIVDDKLSFSAHVSFVYDKVAKSHAVIKKLSFYVPKSTLKSLYTSLVYPHVTYGIDVYGNSCRVAVGRIKRLLGRCIKLIGDGTCDTGSYRRLGLFDYESMLKYFCLLKFFRYNHEGLSNHFSNKIASSNISHDLNTRFSTNRNLTNPFVRSSKLYRSFFYVALHLWNSLPLNVRVITNLKDFKAYMRNKLFSSSEF